MELPERREREDPGENRYKDYFDYRKMSELNLI